MMVGTIIGNNKKAATSEVITPFEEIFKIRGGYYPYGRTIKINEEDILEEENSGIPYWDR